VAAFRTPIQFVLLTCCTTSATLNWEEEFVDGTVVLVVEAEAATAGWGSGGVVAVKLLVELRKLGVLVAEERDQTSVNDRSSGASVAVPVVLKNPRLGENGRCGLGMKPLFLITPPQEVIVLAPGQSQYKLLPEVMHARPVPQLRTTQAPKLH